MCQKLAEEKSIPANISEEKTPSKNLKENLYPKKRRKISTEKSQKKNIDQQIFEEKSLPKTFWSEACTKNEIHEEESLQQRSRNFCQKNQERSLPRKHFLHWKIAKNKSDEIFWNVVKTHFFMKFHEILSGSNLGRKPVTKTRTSKTFLRPSRRISTNAISTKNLH